MPVLPLLHRTGVKAESGGVQTGGGIAEMGFFDPKEGSSVLALLILTGAAALVTHQKDGDEEDAEDRERVEEDEVEEGVVGTHHRLYSRHCGGRKSDQSVKYKNVYYTESCSVHCVLHTIKKYVKQKTFCND